MGAEASTKMFIKLQAIEVSVETKRKWIVTFAW